MADLSGKKVAVVVGDNFQEEELTSPVKALKDAGATVHVIAPHDGEIQALNFITPTIKVKVDAMLGEANPDDYDLLVLPGGPINADFIRTEAKARDFVRKFMKDNKPTASICHAPSLLVSADVLQGRKLTSYFTIQDDIRNAGAEWVDEALVKDGNLMSSRSPEDLEVFNAAIIEAVS